MNLTSPSQVSALLQRHGLRPRKRWGQNFLIDRNTLENVLRAAAVGPEDRVLEIGPGLGTLTRELAQRCRRVAAGGACTPSGGGVPGGNAAGTGRRGGKTWG